jgi:hypothetical protein
MSLESIHTYLIRRASLATGVEYVMELMQTESQFKEIQPFLIGLQRLAGCRHIQDIPPESQCRGA